MRFFGGLALGTVVLCASCAGPPAPRTDHPAARADRHDTHHDARVFLTLHNAARAAVRKPRGYTGDWAPIPPLAWSPSLADSATVWADHLRDHNQCALVHSLGRLGENLAGSSGSMDAREAVALWASEGARYDWSPRYAFRKEAGHFTQLVWRGTTHVGCGEARCGSRTVIVCQYSPPGNVIGRQAY